MEVLNLSPIWIKASIKAPIPRCWQHLIRTCRSRTVSGQGATQVCIGPRLPFPSIFVVRTGTCMFFFWARCVLERTHVDACPRAVDSHSTDGGGSAFQVSPLESSMESVNIARQQGRKRTDCRKRPKGGSTASAYSNITGIVQPSRRVRAVTLRNRW